MQLPPSRANWARTSPRAVLTQGAEAMNQVLASSDLPTSDTDSEPEAGPETVGHTE